MTEDVVGQQTGQGGEDTGGAPAQTYEVKVGGETRKVSLEDLISNYSKGEDYTQKTTALANERRQMQSQLQQALSEREQYVGALREVAAVLQDRDKLNEYIKSQWGDQIARSAQQQAAEEGDLTQERVKELVAEQVAAIKKEFQQGLMGIEQQRELDAQTATYSGVINQKLGELFKEFPLVQKLPNAEFLIRQQVASLNPADINQAIEAFTVVTKAFHDSLSGIQREQAAPAGALRNGIEPPGGAAPGPQPTPAFKNIKDPRLHDMVVEDVKKMFGQG